MFSKKRQLFFFAKWMNKACDLSWPGLYALGHLASLKLFPRRCGAEGLVVEARTADLY